VYETHLKDKYIPDIQLVILRASLKDHASKKIWLLATLGVIIARVEKLTEDKDKLNAVYKSLLSINRNNTNVLSKKLLGSDAIPSGDSKLHKSDKGASQNYGQKLPIGVAQEHAKSRMTI
jgi:hypothetical protein